MAAAPAVRVVVAGANGRMGAQTVRAVEDAPDLVLAARVQRGDDLGAVLRNARADVLVDFTVPDRARTHAETAIRAGVVPLVGTTGLTPDDLRELDALCRAENVGCLVAPNFALGAVLVMRFAAEAARFFPDAEVIEMHHERKLDAPSGTAVLTAERIARARSEAGGEATAPPAGAFEAYPGARGGLSPGGVPVHSVRLPGFVASQEVLLGGPGQRLSLRHDSIDRASFMPGVLLAVRRAREITGLVYGLEHLL